MNGIRYLVAYRPHERGEDALSLAVTLAQSFGADLDLVFVVREHSPFAPAYPPVGREEPIIAEQARGWLDAAAATVPLDIEVRTHVRFAPSVAEGLMAAADELDAALVVLGAGSAGLVRRHELGGVASVMLHRSNRPVALVPRGYRAPGGIECIDCAVGLRPGGQELVDEAVEVAARRQLPLRVITMVDVDGIGTTDDTDGSEEVAAGRDVTDDRAGVAGVLTYVSGLLDAAEATHGAPAYTEIVPARGGIEAAVSSVSWSGASVLLVGSSRVAEPRRFFLGSTVHAMLRTLTVPVIAVPDGSHLDEPTGPIGVPGAGGKSAKKKTKKKLKKLKKLKKREERR